MPSESGTTGDLRQLLVARRGDILSIGLNRPERRNAFSLEMLRELDRAIRGAADMGAGPSCYPERAQSSLPAGT